MGNFDTQIEYKPVIEPPVKSSGTQKSDKITVGAGSHKFEVNVKDGLFIGGETFADAKFGVNFLGEMFASLILIKNDLGQILIDSNSSTGDYVQLINSTLNTQEKEILGEYTFEGSGAIKIANDSNNGLWLSPSGILGKKAGVTTFALTNAGNLTMKGTLLAGSAVVAGDITSGGTILGCNIVSSTNTNRVEMRNGNYFRVIVGGAESGRIYGDSGGDIYIQGDDDVIFRAGGSSRCQVTTGSLKPLQGSGTGNQSYDLGTDPSAGGYGFRNIYGERFYGGASGTGGTTTSGYGFLNGIRWDGGTLQARFSELIVAGGIVTGFDEGSYYNV